MPALSVLRERVRSRLWPLPALAAVLAGVLAAGLSTVRPESADAPTWWPGEASSARGILEVLAGSSLTVVALVFSLQVVALQLAASQYSPRLLRTYTRDGWIQASLAVLLSTFVFSLVTLALFGTVERPPRVSVLVAVLLGLATVGALVGVVAHIVSSLRVERMMADLHTDAEVIVAQVYGADLGALPPGWPPPARAGDDGSAVLSSQSGFVQVVQRDSLVAWADRHEAYLRIDVSPGDHVLAGRPLGRVWPSTPDVDRVRSAVLVGFERTPDADVGFGLLQLSDIAVRALSPGVNDPTTAIHAIGHLAALLGIVAEQQTGPVRRTQGATSVRLVEQVTSLESLVQGVCRPIARVAAADPDVILAVLDLLAYVAERNPDVGPTVRTEAGYVRRAAEASVSDESDLALIRDRAADVAADLAGGAASTEES